MFTAFYYVPPALGARGISRFTVVSRHPNVCWRLSIRIRPSVHIRPSASVQDFAYAIFPTVFH